jgi:NAD(P)-dependent dehydrogenase (short-subunit alcohol dehydrogenase family)
LDFTGKVAVITGGASGLGKATAELMARRGASVLIADVSPKGEEVAAAFVDQGLKVAFMQVDVRSEEQIAAMVKKAVDLWGRLDIMVANAGLAGGSTADQTNLADWDRVVAINQTAVFLCAKHAVPAMRASGGGAIVNMASILGLVGFGANVAYVATKGAVVNLTRAMALDYAKEHIRVNAVCPGFIRTPLIQSATDDPAMNSFLISLHPMGRLGEAEEVAKAVAFLASDDASFITGAALTVDGGYTAQ